MDPSSIRTRIAALWNVSKHDASQQLTIEAKERLVKRTAATYLSGCAGYRASSSAVGQAVLQNVGSLNSLGIQKGLRQLLASDPSFIVQNPQANEAYIVLNVEHVEQHRPAGADTSQQQQQLVRVVPRLGSRVQPPQQQGAAASKKVSSSSTRATPTAGPSTSSNSILSTIACLWPTDGHQQTHQLTIDAKERLVKRAAATYLAGRPGHAASSSRTADYVVQTVGSLRKLGVKKNFRQLLAEDPCFIVQNPHAKPETMVALNVDHLMKSRPASTEAVQQAQTPTLPQPPQQQQQHSQQHGQQGQPYPQGPKQAQQQQRFPPPCAAVNILYPLSGTSDDRVRHVAAKHLLDTHSHSSRAASISAIVQQELGLRIPPSYLVQLLFDGSDIFSVYDIGPTRGHSVVALDASLLRQRAALGRSPQRPQPATTLATNIGSASSSSSEGQIQPILTPPAATAAGAAAADGAAGDASANVNSTAAACSTSSTPRQYSSSSLLSYSSSDDGDQDGFDIPHTALSPSAASAAAADSSAASFGSNSSGVSVRRLLTYVINHIWHPTNVQLNLVRRALAVHLVHQANAAVFAAATTQSDAADSAATTDTAAYQIMAPKAGEVMTTAWKQYFGDQLRCYSTIKEVVSGCKYFSTFATGPSDPVVQLDVNRLLEDAQAGSVPAAQGQAECLSSLSTRPGTATAAPQLSPEPPADVDAAAAAAATQALEAAAAAAMPGISNSSPHTPLQCEHHGPSVRVSSVSPHVRVVPRPAGTAVLQPPQQSAVVARARSSSGCPSNSSSTSIAVSSSNTVAGTTADPDLLSGSQCDITSSGSAGSTTAVTARQLLQYVAWRRWHANPQLDAVRTAVAVDIVMRANADQLQSAAISSAAAAVADQQKYEVTATESGPLIQQVLLQQFPGQRKCYKKVSHAFDDDYYLSTYKSGVSERSIRLNISKLLADVAASAQPAAASTSNPAAGAAAGSAVTTQAKPQPALAAAVGAFMVARSPPGALTSAAVDHAPSAHAASTATQPQQQHQPKGTAAAPPPPPPPPRPPAAAVVKQQQSRSGPDSKPSAPQAAAAGSTVAPSGGTPASAYLSAALQALGGLSLDICRSARVLKLPKEQQARGVDQLLQHMRAAKIAAWDFGLGDQHAAGGKGSAAACITEVSVFVPPVEGAVATVCVLHPTYSVMQQLQPVLSGNSVLNVFHDVRQVSLVLMQQFGIKLQKPLDTQLLAGVTGLAGAAADSTHRSGGSCAGGSSTCTNNGPSRSRLEHLLIVYGYPAQSEQDNVRYILLLARQLMQQLPVSLLALGDLQVLLAEHQQQQQRGGLGSSSLSLKPSMLPGYTPLIQQQAGSIACNMATATTAAPAASSMVHISNSGRLDSSSKRLAGIVGLGPSQVPLSQMLGHQGLTQLCFELRLQHQPAGGWFRSSYEVHLVDDQHDGGALPPGTPVRSTTTVGSGAGCQQAAPGAAGSQEMQASADGGIDEAVRSMVSLLPDRLQPYLQPYVSKQQQPALVEVLIDTNDVVRLRLADKTVEALDISIEIAEVLQHLAAAKQSCKQRQQSMSRAGSLVASRHASSASQNTGANTHGVGGCSKLHNEADATAIPTKGHITHNQGGFFGLFGSKKDLSTSMTELADSMAAGAKAEPANSITSSMSDTQPASSYSTSDTSQLAAACGFGSDNRLGVAGTLHRISAIRDKQGSGVTGLTYRIGRDVPGVARPLADVLSSCKASLDGASVADRPRCALLLGRPGVGKTTLLRNVAYLLSMPAGQGGLGMSVVIVDTSNEIAGDSEERHPCIGTARRMMVRRREDQADVLIEAVQNHTPDVIIVDEIGTRKEVDAARTIAQRGVVLIATAHGNTLGDLLRNPTLRELVGGVTAVTLGDSVAKGGRKTRVERAGAATFNTLVELRAKQEWCLHLDVERSVDAMLGTGFLDTTSGALDHSMGQMQASSSRAAVTQTRTIDRNGQVLVSFESLAAAKQALHLAAVVDQLADRAQEAATTGGSSNTRASQVPHGQDSAAGGSHNRSTGHHFEGAWLIDLVHAAVHRAIESSTTS